MIQVKKLSENAKLPQKSHLGDLGYDLYAVEDVLIRPGKSKLVGTGVSFKMPKGWGFIIKDRSSYACNNLETAAGVVDEGYRGEVKVLIRNFSGGPKTINVGDKIAQFVPERVTNFDVVEVDELDETARGVGGFGSTGE